jgi:hypothetical protein
MLDLDLLRSFVSVVDTGGFTSAGERVHRTQSTESPAVSSGLEESLGLSRCCIANGKQATPTRTMRDGFLLCPTRGGARAGHRRARECGGAAGQRKASCGLAWPEDSSRAYRLTELLSDFRPLTPRGCGLTVRPAGLKRAVAPARSSAASSTLRSTSATPGRDAGGIAAVARAPALGD